MFRSRRSSTVVLTAAASAATFVLATVPASAIPMPTWPAAGHVPIGCDSATYSSGSPLYTIAYVDSHAPTVSDVTINGGTSVAIPPAGSTYKVLVKADQLCSGIGYFAAAWVVRGAGYEQPLFTPTTTDAFHATMGYTHASVLPSAAGVYRLGLILAGPRYGTFTLNSDFTLNGTPVAGPVGSYVTGTWSTKKLYVLRQTTLGTSQSAAKVKPGKTVHVYGLLKYATDTGYKADNGEKVFVQVKVGKGKWVTKATLTASSTGAVAYTFAPTKTSYVRFGHAAVYSGRYTAAIASATRTIVVG
jgi:hypothetical protein